MVRYILEILGDAIVQKEPCYEAPSTFESKLVSISIEKNIFDEFRRKYRIHMMSAGRIRVNVELTPNEDKESKYLTLSKPHFIGFVNSIDDIVLPNRVNTTL
ncbi:MAG: hypothetical protein AABX95_01905 [Nanoarchaeota archaeon]